MRTAFGLLVLGVLLGCIAYAQGFTESRAFCFAMFSSVNQYDIRTTVNGRALTPDEVFSRYQRRANGVEMRSIQHLKNTIRVTDDRNPAGVRTTLTYRTNGRPAEFWEHP